MHRTSSKASKVVLLQFREMSKNYVNVCKLVENYANLCREALQTCLWGIFANPPPEKCLIFAFLIYKIYGRGLKGRAQMQTDKKQTNRRSLGLIPI